MVKVENKMKCKYCDYIVPRWKGRGKFGGKRLWKHVIDNHEEDFLKGIGWDGSLEEYLYMLEEEEDV